MGDARNHGMYRNLMLMYHVRYKMYSMLYIQYTINHTRILMCGPLAPHIRNTAAEAQEDLTRLRGGQGS